MGCLQVEFQRIGGVKVDYTPINDIGVTYERIGGTKVEYKQLNDLNVSYKRLGGLKVEYYLICTVGTDKYLKVTPEEPIWITMDEMGVYTVRSNTDWVVL